MVGKYFTNYYTWPLYWNRPLILTSTILSSMPRKGYEEQWFGGISFHFPGLLAMLFPPGSGDGIMVHSIWSWRKLWSVGVNLELKGVLHGNKSVLCRRAVCKLLWNLNEDKTCHPQTFFAMWPVFNWEQATSERFRKKLWPAP